MTIICEYFNFENKTIQRELRKYFSKQAKGVVPKDRGRTLTLLKPGTIVKPATFHCQLLYSIVAYFVIT